jgi:hypothetical protein
MMADADNRLHWSHPDAHHWSQGDWQSFIVPDDHPELHHWPPGSPLPEFCFTDHLATAHVRAAQRLVHACLLPALDRLRPGHSDSAYPQRIGQPDIASLRAVDFARSSIQRS